MIHKSHQNINRSENLFFNLRTYNNYTYFEQYPYLNYHRVIRSKIKFYINYQF